ncbi:MAG: LamG-like jellyroll fold domain-containing protein, partial [Phycisphaerae bacterium]
GSEQSFTAGVSLIDEVNEANITSIVYSFDTMPSVPVITENPANQLVDMDALAEFTVAYTSVTTPVVQWFKSTDNVNNTPDDDTFAGTGDTLSIAATTASDEGFYYAVISNESGVEAISTSARLEVKKLVAWYPFDNTAETAFITDMAGDFDGVIANEVDPNNPVALSYEATADGNAVSFAAVNQTHIEVPRMVQNSFSFEIWVKTTATGGTGGWWNGQGLIDGEMPGWVDDFGSSLLGSKFGFGAQGGNTLSSTSDINDGEWHYCVGTRDQATGDLYLYVDGAQEAEMLATSTAVLDDATVLRIGDILTGGAYFDGQIDDIKVYNYPLAELTVAQTFNEATGESVCVLSRKPSADFDFNGDCIVGLADFTVFAAQWLDCGIYPDCL